MNILNYRVDDRLVHGCVATMWVPKLHIERVICIDDESANNPMLKNALRMATPNGVFLSVLTHEKAIENLKAQNLPETGGKRNRRADVNPGQSRKHRQDRRLGGDQSLHYGQRRGSRDFKAAA